MQRRFPNTLKTMLILCCISGVSSLALATAPSGAIFYIDPTSTTPISLVGTESATVNYTATNTARATLVGLSIRPQNGISTNILTTSLQNDTCTGINLAPNASCTFTVAVQATGQPANTTLSPAVCGFFGAACSQPPAVNRVSISILRPSTTMVPFAAGSYYDGSTTRPLLAYSPNEGGNWTYVESITTPVLTTHPFVGDGELAYNSCSGSICIAGGGYYDGSVSRPLLALTQNAGSSWNYSNSITAPMFIAHPFANDGNFNGVSCSGNNCIASGTYYDGSVTRPLLAYSQNAGSTWTYSESITMPTFVSHPFANYGSLAGSSCSGNTCVSSGSYYDGSTARPLLAFSQNAGSTWTYPTSIPTPTFIAHPFANYGNLSSVSCNGSTCVGVGEYYDGSTYRPLLAYSQNAGSTWTYSESITTPALTTHPFVMEGFLNSVFCTGNVCVAVGDYSDGITGRPLLAVSQNNGVTWTYSDSITSPTIASHPFVSGNFDSVSCNNQVCIAVGVFYDGVRELPLLAYSTDSGSHWTYSTSAATPVFAAHPLVNGYTDLTSCNASLCQIGGEYYDGSTYRPLLGYTLNNGVTWTYVESLTMPNFIAHPFVTNGVFGVSS